MARAQFRDTAQLRGPGGVVIVAPLGTQAAIYEVGTTTPIGETIYADDSSMSVLPNPLLAGPDGLINFWIDHEREFDIVVNCAGYAPVRTTVTADSAGGWQDDATFDNPHFTGIVHGQPGWEQPQFITIATPSQPFIDHNSLSSLGTADPHTQYLTPERADLRYDALGAASSGDANHLAAANPHPQYLLVAGGTMTGQLNVPVLGVSTFEQLTEIATPATPPLGTVRFYPKADHHLYVLDSLGNENIVGSGGGGGGGSGVISVHEEFTPTPGSTSVTLSNTLTQCLIVARNGVVQSQAAGHYSISGSVISFSTAFGAGERLVVAYQANGTATGEDVALRTYVRGIMATLDPTGPPAP